MLATHTPTTITDPARAWANLAKNNCNYQILGIYANGAARLKGYHGYDERIGFLDCPACQGKGEITIKNKGYWGYNDQHVQCEACALRFGLRFTVIERLKEIISLAKSEVNADKRTGEDVKSAAYIEEFNLYNPLAKEYRELLYRLWAYQEPEFAPVVKN